MTSSTRKREQGVNATCLKKLGQRVRALRQERGWSQETLAAKAELHPSYIGSVERGKRNLSLLSLDKLATAFGLSSAQLLASPPGGHEAPPTPSLGPDEGRLVATMAFFLSTCTQCKKFHELRQDQSKNSDATNRGKRERWP